MQRGCVLKIQVPWGIPEFSVCVQGSMQRT